MPVLVLLLFKSFLGTDTWKQVDGQSHKLIRRSPVILGVLVAFVLFVAIRFRVCEIPPEQLNAWRVPASSSVLTVEQVRAAPQAYSHRTKSKAGPHLGRWVAAHRRQKVLYNSGDVEETIRSGMRLRFVSNNVR